MLGIIMCFLGLVSFFGLGIFGFELVILLTAFAVSSHVPLVAFFTFKARRSVVPEDSSTDPEEYNNALFEMLDRINKRIAFTEASKHIHKYAKETVKETPIEVIGAAPEQKVTSGEENEKPSVDSSNPQVPVLIRKKRLITVQTMLSESSLERNIRKSRCRVESTSSMPNYSSY